MQTRETLSFTTTDDEGWEVDVTLPAKFEVCSRCRGTGSHVNPAVDGNGLTAEDFYEDPDFAEDYRAGVFDVSCYECGGRRVVAVVDEDRADPEDLRLYREYLDALADLRACEAAERRNGA